MNHVLAKVKRLTKNPFLKLISDHTLYENTEVSLDSCVDYTPDHNLDEDSWFKIDSFSNKPFSIELIKKDFDSKDYNQLEKKQFSSITYILSIQAGDFYFQKITPSLFISRKTIGFGEAAHIEKSSNRLIINEQPDAIYIKDSDTLIFRNLAAISGIFKGIDELYRVATQHETEAFLSMEFIDLKNDYAAEKVSKPNRKRIALAMDSLEKMSPEDRVEILAYIGDYCDEKLKFNEDSKKLEIKTDNELKLLLYGIEQRFYTTLFGNEKRLANSVQPIG